jgi:hypothetical protein
MKRVSFTRMTRAVRPRTLASWLQAALLLTGMWLSPVSGATIAPSPYWKDQIAFPYDSFAARGTSKDSLKWVKFTILLKPYDPNIVHFQDSRRYVFHYSFAVEQLDPFLGMSTQQFNAVTLFEENQQAILGTVILPPAVTWPTEAEFQEYGIQFVRQDPFTPEQIRDLFHLVRSRVATPPDVQVFYFPTYEQQATASANRDWFESQGVPLSSTARWAKGNTAYSEGWALGKLKFVTADRIADSYHRGLLEPNDILLTDGVPAEVPFVAGIISLAPSTPNSHVAILARTYAVPFVHLAVADDANYAQQLVDRRILFSAYSDLNGTQTRLIDTENLLDEATVAQILQLKQPAPLGISPMAPYGSLGIPTAGLLPSDIQYVGGKASNFGVLQRAVPENSPRALALTFDLWNAFLDQPLAPSGPILLGPGEYILFWADEDEEQGPTHTGFRLSRGGESIALFDVDGSTLLDAVHFGPQSRDVSYGRSVDGNDTWRSFAAPTPGLPNSASPGERCGRLVINEFMADNDNVIEDPCESGEYADWIELYNASDDTIILNGMYLTDDVNDATKWQIRPEVQASTLREEIALRLSKYDSYPPRDMQMLARDLASIRSLFTNPEVAPFTDELRAGVLGVLTDPGYGIDPNATLRFRSSTNVEDSADFIGAGLYDSFSGCLADDLDDDDDGPCACDPNRSNERSIFRAIRRVFASFYNDNAWLERLRHNVNEAEVGMAILVHPSFPDEIELANGVATVDSAGANTDIALVTQQSAVSVTNPADGSIPEEVTITILPSGSVVPPRLKQPSSLVPLGGTVMAWPGDYTDLADLLIRIRDTFSAITGKAACILDLEYKKVAPGGAVLPSGGLVVKQVREIPTSDRMQTPFLINEPMEFEVFTGEVEIFEATDVFADHRLKSRWKLETHNVILDSNALAETLYANVEVEYLDGDRIGTIAREMALLPFAEHDFDAESTTDGWRLDDLENPRTYRLWTTNIPTAVPPTQRPVLTLADFGNDGYNIPFKCLTVNVEYDQSVISWYQQVFSGGSASGLRLTRQSRVYLWPCTPPSDDDVLQERTFSANGISIRTSFYYPPLPPGMPVWGFLGGNTGPLKRWDRTIIEGLTSEPIVLRGYYSQTFRPEHHNIIEHFLFEPRLEPGISDAVLTELNTMNVRFIHLILDNVHEDGDQSQIQTHGFDKPS